MHFSRLYRVGTSRCQLSVQKVEISYYNLWLIIVARPTIFRRALPLPLPTYPRQDTQLTSQPHQGKSRHLLLNRQVFVATSGTHTTSSTASPPHHGSKNSAIGCRHAKLLPIHDHNSPTKHKKTNLPFPAESDLANHIHPTRPLQRRTHIQPVTKSTCSKMGRFRLNRDRIT